jgi:catechol 2,3-dioxygenase-like lactoylglutathione lyase family enzyme
MADTILETETAAELGPVPFRSLAHVSLPCRDIEEGIAFYVDVLGGELRVSGPIFASFRIAGINVGVGSLGCTFMETSAEYPHLAFYVGAAEMAHLQHWLTQCGIPTTNFWTRTGVEALFFVRDPSGNVIEFFCQSGFEGAKDFPRGPSRGHGTAVDIDAIRYSDWRRPKNRGSRVVKPD